MGKKAPMTLARGLFSLLAWAAQPLLRRKLRKRAVAEPGYAVAVPERFGHYTPADLGQDGRGQWVCSFRVSGRDSGSGDSDSGAARAPARHAFAADAQHGHRPGRGAKLLRPGDVQVWLPWDSLGATRRFIGQFRPAVGVLMETEIWPNLIAGCANAGIPLTLANARLNEKSEAGALKMGLISKPAYGALAAIWAQSEDDARRLRNVGPKSARCWAISSSMHSLTSNW